ncbi:MAG: hypothetical protein ACOY5B_10465 [Spirochaetota bacterium]
MPLNVTSANMTGISVTAPQTTLARGLGQQYTATASYSDGTTANITTLATWDITTPTGTLPTISNTAGSNGYLATTAATTIQTVTVRATMAGFTGTRNLDITAATLNAITINTTPTPGITSVAKGIGLQYTATGTYSDGTTPNITASVNWSITGGAFGGGGIGATTGTLTTNAATNTGTYNVVATLGAVTGQMPLNVTMPVLQNIVISPGGNIWLPLSQQRQLTATSNWSDGTSLDITNSVSWSSSQAHVSVTGGWIQPVSVGSTDITATLFGIPGSVTVHVPAPGSLDQTFGSGGLVTNAMGSNNYANATALQADGKILIAGYNGSAFLVSRYNVDGSADGSFGSGGFVTTAFSFQDSASSIAVQGDGKIVAAGIAMTNNDFAVARYNSDGSLDTTFNGTGKVTTSFGTNDSGMATAIQSDGKIVVAGHTETGGVGDMAVARYNTNGSLDTSFNGTGRLTININGYDVGGAVALQSDGKIIVAGAATGCCGFDFAVARINPNGSLDTSFNGTGRTTISFSGNALVRSGGIALQPDGKIILSGDISSPSRNLAVARLNTNGSLDGSFGTGGRVTLGIGPSSFAGGLALQGNGQILLGGVDDGNNASFTVARLNTNGGLDNTFGTNGITKAYHGMNSQMTAINIRPSPDGRIVAVGTVYGSTYSFLGIAQFWP